MATKGILHLSAIGLLLVIMLFYGGLSCTQVVYANPEEDKVTPLTFYNQEDREKKHVLLLHSYHEGFPWVDTVNKGILDALKPEENLEFHFEYMDAKRFIQPQDALRFEVYFDDKYHKQHFDAILVSDDAAYQFILRKQPFFFQNTPVIFCGVNRFSSEEIKQNQWVTGVVEKIEIRETIEAALAVHPKVKKVVVINDRTEIGASNRLLLEQIQKELPETTFVFWEDMTMQEVQAAAASLDDSHLILMMTFNVDRSGAIYGYEDSLEQIAGKAAVPIYGIWDFYLGHGLVGGKVTSGYSQGETARQLALKILQGKGKPQDIPVVLEGANPFIYDYKQIEKWKIDEKRLPTNSQVINRPVRFYDTYKTLVWTVGTAFCLLFILLFILLINIRRRKQSEAEVRQLNEDLEVRVQVRTQELESLNQQLTATLTELKSARQHLIEVEKMASLGELVAGVAHEINTPIGNGVTAASHLEGQLAIIKEKLTQGTIKKSDLFSFLDLVERVARSILTNLQRGAELVQSFKQVAVDQMVEERRCFNLYGYLQEVLLSLRPRLKKTKVAVVLDGTEDVYIEGYPGALWQIFSNLLINSLLHAYEPEQAGSITITLQQQGGQVFITYTDDGKGMPEEVRKKIFEPFFTTRRGSGGTGLGMHIVYNLVVFKLQGTIECSSQIGKGTQFIIAFPQMFSGEKQVKGRGEAIE